MGKTWGEIASFQEKMKRALSGLFLWGSKREQRGKNDEGEENEKNVISEKENRTSRTYRPNALKGKKGRSGTPGKKRLPLRDLGKILRNEEEVTTR